MLRCSEGLHLLLGKVTHLRHPDAYRPTSRVPGYWILGALGQCLWGPAHDTGSCPGPDLCRSACFSVHVRERHSPGTSGRRCLVSA